MMPDRRHRRQAQDQAGLELPQLGWYADQEFTDESDRRTVATLFSAMRPRCISFAAMPLRQGFMRPLAAQQILAKLLQNLHDDKRDRHSQ